MISSNVQYLHNLDLWLNDKTLDKFSGLKYVCMQGSGERSKTLAQKLAKHILGISEELFTPVNLFTNGRFEGYRVGNILLVSHGMGITSVMNLLDDLTKLMWACNNKEFEYIRIGTSGGINIAPGSVILTDMAYKPDLTTGYTMTILGKDITFPTLMNQQLNERIINAQPQNLPFALYRGNSISAEDFYLGQCRFDGAIKPWYNEEIRREYFYKIIALNIYNFEMESTAIAAFCNRANIPATMIAVTILDRLQGDQVSANQTQLATLADHPHIVIINYLDTQLNN